MKTSKRLLLFGGLALSASMPAMAQEKPHLLILLDCSGSMTGRRVTPNTPPNTLGNTRWMDALTLAGNDLKSFRARTLQAGYAGDAPLFSICTSNGGSGYLRETGPVFVDFTTALTCLAAFDQGHPTGSTPLAEAACQAISDLDLANGFLNSTVFTATNYERRFQIHSDELDTDDGSLCLGPYTQATGGDRCTPIGGTAFTPANSWESLICFEASLKAVVMDTHLYSSVEAPTTAIGRVLLAWSRATGGEYSYVADGDPYYPSPGFDDIGRAYRYGWDRCTWEEGFESYTSLAFIDTQAPSLWENWQGSTVVSDSSAVVDPALGEVRTGQRSLYVRGSTACSCTDSVCTFRPGGAPITEGHWTFSGHVYVPGNFTGGRQYFIALSQFLLGGVAPMWNAQVYIDSTTGMVDADVPATQLCSGPCPRSQPIQFDTWAEICMDINLTTDIVSLYYGGDLMYQYAWSPGVNGSKTNAPTLAALDLFPDGDNVSEVYYDDLSLVRNEELIGTLYCSPAVPNSTSFPGVMTAALDICDTTHATLKATQLPPGQFGVFPNSLTQGFVPNPGGSLGTLCLGGSIGRFTTVQWIESNGEASLEFSFLAIPSGAGFVGVQAGETWKFQFWHRDLAPGPASNFTDALSVTF